MWFRKEYPNSYRFILDRFIDKSKKRFDAPIVDTCICTHGDFEHRWNMWFLFIRTYKCKNCDCKKWRNVGKFGFSERYTIRGNTRMGLRIRPSEELETLLKNNGL